jgi:hypothetical protein
VEEIKGVEIKSFGVKEKRYYLEGISYESISIVWDSREHEERYAYYFGYNEREKFHLFLRREKEKVEMYVIKDEKCWVKYWDECSIPCLDTKFIGNLGETREFQNQEEKEYTLKRLLELEQK